MRRMRARAGAWTVLVACAVAGALPAAASSKRSDGSRGFFLDNESNRVVILINATKVECSPARGVDCDNGRRPMGFDGRPPDGAQLYPHSLHRWELKYTNVVFSNAVQWAAHLHYRIAGGGEVSYTIETTTYENNSRCHVTTPEQAHFTCTAHGRDLTFKNK